MRNEVAHVERLVADIAAQDLDRFVELLVADGGSTDGSLRRLTEAARQARVELRVIFNPARWVPQGLNACIRQATGDLIVRLDCHSRYPPDYLRRCVLLAEETGAHNVGGIVVPEGRTRMERAVACAMDSAFGGIGWTRHGKSPGVAETDTVTYGAFRPDAFRLAGLFDESLIRNQDDEFNLRLREAGGTILLDPSIRVYYTPRGSLLALFRQYYQYGLWKPHVMRKHRKVLSARSLAPLAFVASLVALVAAGMVFEPARWLLAAELAAYAGAAVAFGLESVRRRRESWRLLPRVLVSFLTFHVAYGLGMLRGSIRVLLPSPL
jgi:succinoglycan biosynthesis protein ExoA